MKIQTKTFTNQNNLFSNFVKNKIGYSTTNVEINLPCNVTGQAQFDNFVKLNSNLDVSGQSNFQSEMAVNSNVSVSNDLRAGNVIIASDQSIKKNITTINDGLSKVLSLRGVEYQLIKDSSNQIGLIAQEVEKVVPQVVKQSGDIKCVAYPNLVGLLIEAIKELNLKVETLENKIKKLEANELSCNQEITDEKQSKIKQKKK